MVQKYVTHAQSDRSAVKVNAWFKYCEKEKVPCVTITTKRKYADVGWDYITLPKEMDAVIQSKAKQFTEEFIVIFNKHSNRKSRYTLDGAMATFSNIEVDKAQRLASDIYDYLARELKCAK